MEHRQKSKLKNNLLTLDFGPFSQPRQPPREGLFQKVKSEMLKRKERAVLRRKPLEYEKLEASLSAKLKLKSYNREEEKVQLVMLEKCKNYFQLRKPKAKYLTPKPSRHEAERRPQTSGSCLKSVSSSFAEQL